MLKNQVSQILSINLSQIKRLGIDEIALVKGQGNYLAVLVDLDSHKPIEIVQSRRIEDIREVLVSWGIDVLNEIEEVSIDLWSPYKRLVEELMPNANITADRFHVMKQITKEEFRIQEPEWILGDWMENRGLKPPILNARDIKFFPIVTPDFRHGVF